MLVLILFCEEITVMVLNKAHCVDFCTLLLVYQFVFIRGCILLFLLVYALEEYHKILDHFNTENTDIKF